MYDIIPDIHGQAEKLRGRLTALGYARRNGAWRHPEPGRVAVFLGDFIDRGPDNAEVVDIVRRMRDAGTAYAVMGNHELNAVQYHTTDPRSRARAAGPVDGLRTRSPKNTRQHQTFLAEFPLGSREADEIIAWMRTLPLFLEFDDFRAVHACWDEARIAGLRAVTKAGVLGEEQFVEAADCSAPLFDLVETTTKGPEHPLPVGCGFHDKDGVWRDYVRLRWWARQPRHWAELSISVPDPSELPDTAPPADVLGEIYPATAPPVFFGHYWLTGEPVLQAPNALCLDYSAGKDGPLVSYLMEPGQKTLSLNNLDGHPSGPRSGPQKPMHEEDL